MSTDRRIRNLALVGFMGTGKSSVGRQLAAELGFEFVDTDELIESRAGRSISEIFEQSGEAAFRELEAQVVKELSTREKLVISTGGGLIVNPANLASLKSHALVVCLWASPDSIWQRVRGQTHRPLLATPDPLAKIRALLAEREPHYKRADVLVNTELRSVRDVTLHVLHQFQFAGAPPRKP